MDLVGEQVFGPYRVTRVIDDKGASAVLEAASGDHKIALRLLGPEASRDITALSLASMEAVVVSALEHPHIARVRGLGELDDGRPFVALELLQGEGLEARLASTGRLPPPQVRRLVEQAGGALQAVHAEGMIHGGLKPRYVFLARHGEQEVVKLLGFGICRVADPLIPGPGSFLSPELERGEEPDHKTDIFSLGSIAYLALGGAVPGPEPRPISELVPDLPRSLDAVMRRAMAPAREDRYPKVELFVEAFLQATAGLEPSHRESFLEHSTVLLDEGPDRVAELPAPSRPTGPMPLVTAPMPVRATHDTGPVARPSLLTGPMPAVPAPARPALDTGPVPRPLQPTGPMPAVPAPLVEQPGRPARDSAIQPRRTAIAPPLEPEEDEPREVDEVLSRAAGPGEEAPNEQQVEDADDAEDPTDFIAVDQLFGGQTEGAEDENKQEEPTILAMDVEAFQEAQTTETASATAGALDTEATAETGPGRIEETLLSGSSTAEFDAGETVVSSHPTAEFDAGETVISTLPTEETADSGATEIQPPARSPLQPADTAQFEDAATMEFRDPSLLDDEESEGN